MNPVKFKSPNNGLHLGQIKARLMKPTKEQADFIKAHPVKVERAKLDKRNGSDIPPGQAKQPKEGRKVEVEKANPSNPGNPGKPEKAEKPTMKQQKSDQGGNPGGKPQNPEQSKGQGKGKGKP